MHDDDEYAFEPLRSHKRYHILEAERDCEDV